jgi:hypothetical protein
MQLKEKSRSALMVGRDSDLKQLTFRPYGAIMKATKQKGGIP